jgi:hypothetical protein
MIELMKPNFRKVLEMALEEGVRYGYNRAHKHVENPTEGAIIDNIVEQVMNSLYEWFDFEDECKDD